MQDEKQLQDRLMSIFVGKLPKIFVERVMVSDTIDSIGNEAVLITFVLTAQGAAELTGDQTLDLLVDVQGEFMNKGDGRFPIVGYATEAELDEKDAA